MAGMIAALALGTYSLRGQVQTIIEQLPEAATKFSTALARFRSSQSDALQKIQNAATQVETAATRATGGAVTPRQPATHVIVICPNSAQRLSVGRIDGRGRSHRQAAMVVFLVFFLLLGGDTFKRKLVRITGPSLSKRKITVKILDDINGSIQKYMLMLLATNLLVVLLSWMAFHAIASRTLEPGRGSRNLPHRSLSRACGCCVATAMAAFMQFDSFAMALLAAAPCWGSLPLSEPSSPPG